MSEAFEREVIDRLARIETRLGGIDGRLDKVEGANNNSHMHSMAGGGLVAFGTAGVAVVLKLLGWL